MKECITLKTMKEIKIISNPIRMKVLKNYYTYAKPATVKQMAVHMGEVPANIHYHVKKLLEINVLELHHTKSVNGIIAKFYIPVAKKIKIKDEDQTEGDVISEKELILSNLFDEGKKEFIHNMREQDEQSHDGLFVSTHAYLTEEEYQTITALIQNTSENKSSDDPQKKKYLIFSSIVEAGN